MAVLAEFLVGGLDAARLRLLAGRVLAVDGMVGGAGFIETFRLLRHDQGFAARAAFVMAMRIARRLLECADTCAWADPSQLGTGAVG